MKVAGVELTGRDFARCGGVVVVPLGAAVGLMIHDQGVERLWDLLIGIAFGLFLVLGALALLVIRRRDHKAGRAAQPHGDAITGPDR